MFELVKIVFTLLITGIVGGAITYYYQDRAQRKQLEAKELETARESTITFLREVGDILERRKFLAYKCLNAFKNQRPPADTEEMWKAYQDAVGAWNLKWNLYRALTLEELGPEVQKRFYDPIPDDKGDWSHCSITCKLIVFHERLSAAHDQRLAGQPVQDAKKISELYDSLAEDCYNFYSTVIERIQEGKVGKSAWPATTKR